MDHTDALKEFARRCIANALAVIIDPSMVCQDALELGLAERGLTSEEDVAAGRAGWAGAEVVRLAPWMQEGRHG